MATEPSESSRDSMDSGSTSPKPSDRPEIAHVLFLDVVAFTTLHMEEQRESLKRLQQAVSATPTFRQAEHDKRLISLPTGDGMALAFFGDPIASVECALEISELLLSHPDRKSTRLNSSHLGI